MLLLYVVSYCAALSFCCCNSKKNKQLVEQHRNKIMTTSLRAHDLCCRCAKPLTINLLTSAWCTCFKSSSTTVFAQRQTFVLHYARLNLRWVRFCYLCNTCSSLSLLRNIENSRDVERFQAACRHLFCTTRHDSLICLVPGCVNICNRWMCFVVCNICISSSWYENRKQCFRNVDKIEKLIESLENKNG